MSETIETRERAAGLRDDLVDARLAADVQTYRRWSDRAKFEAAKRSAETDAIRAGELASTLDKMLGWLHEERALSDKRLAESKALLDQFDADTRKASRRFWIYTALFAVFALALFLWALTAPPHPT